MGTNMMVGVCTEIIIDKTQKSFIKNDIEEVKFKLNEKLDLSLYDYKEDDKELNWVIKDIILENQMCAFLKRQFSFSIQEIDQKDIIESLSNLKTAEEIKKKAEEQIFQNYQITENYDYIKVGEWKETVKYEFEMILYCMEGRAMMECYKNIFNYFEKMIRLQSKEFSIANAVKIVISL